MNIVLIKNDKCVFALSIISFHIHKAMQFWLNTDMERKVLKDILDIFAMVGRFSIVFIATSSKAELT